MADAQIVVTPVPKKSTDSLHDYISYFQRVSTANSWNDNKQAVIFPSLLEVGNKSVDGLSAAALASFTEMKKALLGDSEPLRESNVASLMHLARKPGEPLQRFRERVAGLIEICYPRFAAVNARLFCT